MAKSPAGADVYSDGKSGIASSEPDASRERSQFFKNLLDHAVSVEAILKNLSFDTSPRSLEAGEAWETHSAISDPNTIWDCHGRMLQAFKEGNLEEIEEETRFGLHLEDECLTLLSAEIERQRAVEAWARFDLFFGVLVLFNAVFLGAVVQDYIDEVSMVARIAEGLFFLAYLVEFAWRCYYIGHWRTLMADSWVVFDFVVLVLTAVDVVVVGLLSSATEMGSGTSSLAIIRLLRVLRALRLMRLLRLFGQFWLLIRGMLDSIAFVSWAVLMIIIASYLFGMFIFEVIQGDTSDEVVSEFFGSMPACLGTMLQIATFDGAYLVQYLINNGNVDSSIIFLFLFFNVFCAIGMINVIIGVLVNSSIDLALQDAQLEDINTRFTVRQHLRVLRLALKSYFGRRGTATTDAVLSRQSVFALLFDEVPLEEPPPASAATPRTKAAAKLNKAWIGKSFHELFAIADITERDTNVIFNALEGAVGGLVSISIDDFIERCIWLKEDVHPLAIFNLFTGLLTNLQKLRRMDDSLTIVLHALDDTLNEVQPLLSKYHSRQGEKEGGRRENLARSLVDKNGLQDRREGLKQAARDQEAAAISNARLSDKETELLGNVDQLFAIVLFFNAVTLGVELGTQNSSADGIQKLKELTPSIALMWWVVEVVFLILYTAEVWIRVCLYYQMRVQKRYTVMMGYFPKVMYRMTFTEAWEVIKYSRTILRENRHILFDLFIILIAVVDTLILPWTDKARNAAVLQAARMSRAMRFGRIPHIMAELQLINAGLTNSLPLLAWSIFLLFAIVYACAIIMVEAVGMSGALDDDPALKEAWSDLGSVILSLIETIAYSPRPLMEISEYVWWIYVFAPVFITLTTVGLMNLVTGMMIVSSYRITAGKRFDQVQSRLMVAKTQILEASKRMFEQSRETQQIRLQNVDERIDRLKLQGLSDAVVYKHNTRVLFRCSTEDSDDIGALRFSRPRTLSDEAPHQHDQEHALGASVNDQEASCTVLHVLWISTNEIAMDFKVASRAGADELPWPGEPILTWHGGAQAPEGSATIDEEGKGRFVWKGLPQVSKFSFSYGTGYSSVKITPDSVRDHDIMQDFPKILEDDRETHISARNLAALMKDITLVKELKTAGLRPDQAFLVFQKLLLEDTSGSVSLDDFVQALARIRLPVQGIDIASAKNLLRRAVLESKTLKESVRQSRDGVGKLVERLRDVRLLDPATEQANFSGSKSNLLDMGGRDVEESCAVLERQNRVLRCRIKVLQRYDKDRRARMRANGDFGVRKAFYTDDDLFAEKRRREEEKTRTGSKSPRFSETPLKSADKSPLKSADKSPKAADKSADKLPKSPGTMLRGGSGPTMHSPQKSSTTDVDGSDRNSDSSWSDDDSIHSAEPGFE